MDMNRLMYTRLIQWNDFLKKENDFIQNLVIGKIILIKQKKLF